MVEDKKETQAETGRRFQREGPITEKDLDIAIVVLHKGAGLSGKSGNESRSSI